MWEIDNNWQSDEFKQMLFYERLHEREKFIYGVNKVLYGYINNNFRYMVHYNDPQLLALIFSLISITYNKDDLSEYIKNENLSSFMSNTIYTNDEYNTSVMAHFFRKMPEANIDIGETFVIPESTLLVYYNENGKSKKEFILDDWEFKYDHDILSIEAGKIKALKNGCTIVECYNKKRDRYKKIKINSGNIKQTNITEYFFSQIRNIIAHGLFTFANSGGYDTLKEYGSYNMLSFDNRYLRGMQREVCVIEENQLNVAYDKDNFFNPRYISYLAETLYAKENNPFIRFIKIFDNNNDFVSIKNELDVLYTKEKLNFEALLILSKFYINFIYNYDANDKKNYNYDNLNIRDKLKGNLSNQEYIYMIRTSIMHGRYLINKNRHFVFFNTDKKDSEKISFFTQISFDELKELCSIKEKDFKRDMEYDPRVIEEGKLYSDETKKL